MIGKFRVKKVFRGEGYPAVGLAEQYIKPGINNVTILAKNTKTGEFQFPGLYQISDKEIKDWPLKQYKGVPAQYIVPLDALKKVSNTTYLNDYRY